MIMYFKSLTGFVEDYFIPPQGNEGNKKETIKSLLTMMASDIIELRISQILDGSFLYQNLESESGLLGFSLSQSYATVAGLFINSTQY